MKFINKNTLLAIVMLTLAVSLCVSVAGAETMVTHTSNISFEDNITGWKLYASNLTKSAGISQSTDAVLGTHSIRIDANATSDISGEMIQDFTYSTPILFNRAGIWIKAINCNNGSHFTFRTNGTVNFYTALYMNNNTTQRITGTDWLADGQWHYYEWTLADSATTTTTKVDLSTTNLTSGAILIDGAAFYTVLSDTHVETCIGNTTLHYNTTYTPEVVYANQTVVIRYDNYSLKFLPASTSTCLVDGVSTPCQQAGDLIYIDMAGATATAHNINVTTVLSSPVIFPNTSNKLAWRNVLWSARVDSGVTHNNTFNKYCNWLDTSNDTLHIAARNIKGVWSSSELYSNHTKLYGTYTWVVDNKTLSLDRNLVCGLFTFASGDDELDIEFTRWQNQTNNNTWLTIQPYDIDGNRVSDTLRSDEPLKCVMVWQPDSVAFQISKYNSGTPLKTFIYTNTSGISDVVQQTVPTMWQYTRPANFEEADVAIMDFQYSPYVAPATGSKVLTDTKDNFVQSWTSTVSIVAAIIIIMLASVIITTIRGKGNLSILVDNMQSILLVAALLIVGTIIFSHLY